MLKVNTCWGTDKHALKYAHKYKVQSNAEAIHCTKLSNVDSIHCTKLCMTLAAWSSYPEQCLPISGSI